MADRKYEIGLEATDNVSGPTREAAAQLDALNRSILQTGQSAVAGSGQLQAFVQQEQQAGQAAEQTAQKTATAAAQRQQAAAAAAEAHRAEVAAQNLIRNSVREYEQVQQAAIATQRQFAQGAQQIAGALGLLNPQAGAVAGGMANIGAGAGLAVAGFAAAGTAAVALGAHLAGVAQEQEHQLAITKAFLEFRGQGGAYQESIAGLEQLRVQGQLVGATFTDLQEAFRRAVEHTDDAGTAMKATALAVNIATINGQSLHQVLQRLDAAYEGQTRSLRNLGLHINDAGAAYLRSLEPAERTAFITEMLENRFSGLSSAYDDTATHQAQLEVNFQRLQNNIGHGLIPVVDGAVRLMLGLGDAMRHAADNAGKLNDAMRAGPGKQAESGGVQYDPATGMPLNALYGLAGVRRDLPELRDDRAGSGTTEAAAAEAARRKFVGGNAPLDPADRREMAEQARADAALANRLGEERIAAEAKARDAIKQRQTENRREYQETERQIRQTWKAADEAADQWATSERQHLTTVEQAHREMVAQANTLEEQRHTAEERRIRDGESAELASLEARKRAATDWAQQRVAEIERVHTADRRTIEAAEKADLDRIDRARDFENRRYQQQGYGFADERTGRQVSDELATRGIDRDLTARSQQREADKVQELAGIKELSDAREAQYRDDTRRLEAEHTLRQRAIEQEQTQTERALEAEKTARSRQLQDEATERTRSLEAQKTATDRALEAQHTAHERFHTARLQQISDEAKAVEDSVRQQTQAIERAAEARKYAEEQTGQIYTIQRARFELEQAKASGEDHNRIVELQHALEQAQQRQTDLYQGRQDTIAKQGLTDQGAAAGGVAEQAKRAEDARYQIEQDADQRARQLADDNARHLRELADDTTRHAKESADDADTHARQLAADRNTYLRQTEDDRVRQDKAAVDDLYGYEKGQLEARRTDAEQRAKDDIQRWQNEATASKDAIKDATTTFEADLNRRVREAQQAHEDTLARIATERAAEEARYAAIKLASDDKAADDKAAVEFSKQETLVQIGLEEAAARKRWQGEKDDETEAHNTYQTKQAASQRLFDVWVTSQTTYIEKTLKDEREAHAATYGDVPGGLLFQLNAAKQAAEDNITAQQARFQELTVGGKTAADAWRAFTSEVQASDNALAGVRQKLQDIHNIPPPPVLTPPAPDEGYTPPAYGGDDAGPISSRYATFPTGYVGGAGGRVIPVGRTGIQGGEAGYPTSTGAGGPAAAGAAAAYGGSALAGIPAGVTPVWVVNAGYGGGNYSGGAGYGGTYSYGVGGAGAAAPYVSVAQLAAIEAAKAAAVATAHAGDVNRLDRGLGTEGETAAARQREVEKLHESHDALDRLNVDANTNAASFVQHTQAQAQNLDALRKASEGLGRFQVEVKDAGEAIHRGLTVNPAAARPNEAAASLFQSLSGQTNEQLQAQLRRFGLGNALSTWGQSQAEMRAAAIREIASFILGGSGRAGIPGVDNPYDTDAAVLARFGNPNAKPAGGSGFVQVGGFGVNAGAFGPAFTASSPAAGGFVPSPGGPGGPGRGGPQITVNMGGLTVNASGVGGLDTEALVSQVGAAIGRSVGSALEQSGYTNIGGTFT